MAPTTLRVRARTDDRYVATFVYAAIAAAALYAAIQYDRRPPLKYIDTKIVPTITRPGGDITVHRYVEWSRYCRGEATTDIISPKGYVFHRQMATPAIPPSLGFASVATSWTLPLDLLADGDTVGTATYRGIIRFNDCGFTSWFVPLTVSYQEREFEVRR
jgi:hypothetical protein